MDKVIMIKTCSRQNYVCCCSCILEHREWTFGLKSLESGILSWKDECWDLDILKSVEKLKLSANSCQNRTDLHENYIKFGQ